MQIAELGNFDITKLFPFDKASAPNEEFDQFTPSRYKRCKAAEGDAIGNESVEESSNIVQFYCRQG